MVSYFMISKLKRIITRPQFDVEFTYSEGYAYQKKEKEGRISVTRLSGGDTLQIIKFWGGDRLKTFEEFDDVCTCWCDRNAA